MQRPEIWKFGGASLADGHAITRAAALIAAHDGPLVVVASALAGVTDLLLHATPLAAMRLRQRHRRAAAIVAPGTRARKRLLDRIDESLDEYRAVTRAIAAVGHRTPRIDDLLVARGERLSAMLLAAAVTRATRRPVTLVDAAALIGTDNIHGGATPRIAETARAARRLVAPRLARRGVVVVPGFIGGAPDGSVTTLGRGGSDLTATLLARVLRVPAAVLWKDVPGILTADPRLVPDARVIPHLHHREAAEVAHYGARVLHPRALSPLTGTRVSLHVRSFLAPEAPGTTVSGRRGPAGFPVKSVAHLGNQAVVAIAGSGLMGVPGTAARAFAAIGVAGVSVSTIFQASSEHSIGFTVPADDAGRAEDSLRHAFERELQDGRVEGLTVRTGVTVIAVVGDGMAGTPGVAARLFAALAAASVNVIAIAQGSSERNISFVVADADAGVALRRVHAAFALARIGGGRPQPAPVTDVILLGFGRVGRALAGQIAATGGRQVRVAGVIDRGGYVFDARGLSRARLAALVRGKEAGVPLARLGGRRATADDALGAMAAHAMRHAVLVDVTDQPTLPLHRAALGHACDLVLANKLPLSGPREDYDGLFAAAADARREIRHEATVGAGLPVIDTFRKLNETGDRVDRIDGCLSGTLMFVLSEVSCGRRFSEAVREAVDRGYAEPDPREDLSGRDAARKGVILARLLGYRGPAPQPDDLVPPALRRVPLDTFLRRLPDLDADWHARVSQAAGRGRVLRYVVTATPRRVSARLIAVAPDDPLGAAGGTRNIVSFSSRRYRDEPLVVAGPGAGAAVTAAGLLNDIRALHERRARAMLD